MAAPKTSRPTSNGTAPITASSAGPDFNLRALVREVSREAHEPDTQLIAKEVARRLPPEHAEAVLVDALSEYVRHYLTTARPRLLTATTPTGNTNSGRSSKVRGIRDAWRRYLDEAAYDTATGQKWLGDLDATDLVFVADGLERKAREQMAKSARFREMSAALAEHEAERVRDLPDAVLAEFLSGDVAA